LVDLDNPREKSFDWSFNENDVVTISVENSERTMHPMQHPIHIHGQKFIVKSINGVETDNRVFKDVVQIPVGDTYELVVRMENIGTWLLHCHISEHMESGMVGKFTVQ
jgi:FtsP/CotA-like multicopper oxidase with cupredoxin domain